MSYGLEHLGFRVYGLGVRAEAHPLCCFEACKGPSVKDFLVNYGVGFRPEFKV